MSTLSTFGRRFYKLTQLLEDPKLLRLYRRGVPHETYLRYNRPWFRDRAINTIIDIGANTGQFSRTVRAILPDAQIYAFEPLPDCFHTLMSHMPAHNFKAFNVGLGSAEATLTFHRNPYADSSSFRPMTDLHRDNFPFTAGPETLLSVPVRPLDSFKEELNLKDEIFVKMDVQGFEDEVIEGGSAIISSAAMVVMEVSFAPLYEGVAAFDKLYTRMKELGFEFKGCLDQLIAPIDGTILQGDALFTRASP